MRLCQLKTPRGGGAACKLLLQLQKTTYASCGLDLKRKNAVNLSSFGNFTLPQRRVLPYPLPHRSMNFIRHPTGRANSHDAEAMNTHVRIQPWRGSAVRPFAPSLERLRLQTYLFLLIFDLLVIGAAFICVGAWHTKALLLLPSAITQASLILPIYTALALYNGTFSARSLTRASFGISRAATALILATGLMMFVSFYAKVTEDFSRVVLTVATILALFLMSGMRFALVRYLRRQWGPSAQNLLVIDDAGPEVAVPHAYVVCARAHQLDMNVDDPGVLDRLGRCMQNMDKVIVSCPAEKRKHWAFFLRAAGVDGEVVTEVGHELGAIGLRQHDDFTSMIVSARPLGLTDRAIKRIIDVCISGAAIIALMPLLLLVALAIKLQDGGPVFFIQRRMGRGNRFFGMYKFRSMRVELNDADGNRSASRDDNRITPVGRIIRRTSIDELPQLLNVLRGDMSLVGPRPHALGSQAGEKLFWQVDGRYWYRHSLRPGLTGLAQIRGYRGATDEEADLHNRLRADLEYIANWTPWRDFYIMIQTVGVLIHSRAY